MSELKFKSLPDLAGAFQLMKLRDDLDLELALSSDTSIISYSIGLSLKDKVPFDQILENIVKMYNHNPDALLNILGEELMYRILSVNKNKKL